MARYFAGDHAPSGVRRAPRALEDVKKVLTGTEADPSEADPFATGTTLRRVAELRRI